MLLKHMVKNLPEAAQKRVKALKNLQLEFLRHECTFFEEVYQLERKYQEKYQSIADKRKSILSGEYEPTPEEAEFKSDNEEEDDEDATMMQERLKSMKSLQQYDANVKGTCGCSPSLCRAHASPISTSHFFAPMLLQVFPIFG
jgi:nucleosome assembly protein 1-like 1